MFYIRLFFALSLLLVSSIHTEETKASKKVIVPINVYAFVIDSLTNGYISSCNLVPESQSIHTFEPTAKQVMEASSADIWFSFNEPFEKRLQKSFVEQNPGIHIVDLTTGIDLLYDHHEKDTHIWLSPKQMQKQVLTIKNALIVQYPWLESTIEKKYPQFIEELEKLDKEVHEILKDLDTRFLFVSHPAFGYFCKDYNLDQVAIEVHGKEPGAKKLSEIIEQVEKAHVPALFIQIQHPSKSANVIAEKLNLKLVTLDPLAKNYFQNIRTIAETIQANLKHK